MGINRTAACEELRKWEITEFGNSDVEIITANQRA
jgi:hypothetical protein